MILIWRGWGLLGVVVLFPLLAVCAGLVTVEPMYVFLLVSASCLLAAGATCIYCGMRWNRHGVEHSLYFLPLQVWGWVHLAHAAFFAVCAIGGGFKKGAKVHDQVIPIAGGVACIAAAIVFGWVTPRLRGLAPRGRTRPRPNNTRPARTTRRGDGPLRFTQSRRVRGPKSGPNK